jgi:hypothetical protein
LLLFHVVFHPLCDFNHPFDHQILATRLWPNPPTQFDPAELPTLSPVGRNQLSALIVEGMGAGIPAPHGRLRLAALPTTSPANLNEGISLVGPITRDEAAATDQSVACSENERGDLGCRF